MTFNPGTHPRAWLRVALAVAAIAWGGNHFIAIMLMYRQTLGVSEVFVTFLMGVYVVGIVPGFLSSGPFSNRLGRKNVLVAGLVASAAASVVLACGPLWLPLMALGRIVSGAAVAICMVVGTSWIKELSSPPFSRRLSSVTIATRATVCITAGLTVGALVAGALAQWAPAPTVLPYLVHIAVVLVTLVGVLPVPDVRVGASPARLLRCAWSRTRNRPYGISMWFLAPWVFGSVALGNATIPSLVLGQTGGIAVLFATIMVMITLGSGLLIQRAVPVLTRVSGGRLGTLSLMFVTVGIALMLPLALWPDQPAMIVVALFSGVVQGCGYGLCLVTCLVRTQAVADRETLAMLNGITYSLTYIGFLFPAIIAVINVAVSSRDIVTGLLIAITVSAAIVLASERAGEPAAMAQT